MKAFQLEDTCGIGGLMLRCNLEKPEPGPDEVLIRVRAASLNFRDYIVAHGQYPVGVKPCVIPLSDGAGDVVEVGISVTTVKVGDRVAGCFFPDWVSGPLTQEIFQRSLGGPLDGMLAEYVVLPQRAVIPFPEHLSYQEAATLPNAGVTAWHALVKAGRIRAGQTVLLLGTGGVSLFALQFAKLHSAIVIQTSSSDEKLERAKAMGADYLINYENTPEWDEEVMKLTDGRGVDIVVEVGGAQTLERSLRAARFGGMVTLIGLMAGFGKIDPLPLILRSIRMYGINVGSADMFRAMNLAIATSGLHPVITRTFPFDHANYAYAYQFNQTEDHFGKTVITV
ncbi:zinc-dependent alcohol dehydrogenase family protein [Nitrosospira briensis]|uniref:zinc-dependent alcohol dehydrogenase family protein n=1 Tax=Nitrosospira briensis TaxID=35799 RepID=UPI000468C8B8|nr:NAD(P)-dependent alcohol dehydrogenase [Nitrosospira briensis]